MRTDREYWKTLKSWLRNETILSSIAQDMMGLKDSVDSLKYTVDGLEDKIMCNISIIREETGKFDNEIEVIKGGMDNVEARITALTGESTNLTLSFYCNTSVIVINLIQHADEDPAAVCQGLFSNVLEIDVMVAKVEWLKLQSASWPPFRKKSKFSVRKRMCKIMTQPRTYS